MSGDDIKDVYRTFVGVQDLATVNHTSYQNQNRVHKTVWSFPQDFQAHKYSANSAPLGTVKWSFRQMDMPLKQN